LGQGGAAFIKWGQWSSTRSDIFPEELCQALEKLQAQAPEHGFSFTKRAIFNEFGDKIENIFDYFEERPIASGSIAQVYKAGLHGRDVAVKVRHPNVYENIKLDFRSPYGCSKGIADQYLLDYNRIYGLKTLSFRQSSVYGHFQKPLADQGWLAFFLEEARAGRIIQLNGRGKQVRDVLFAQDLVELFIAASAMPAENFGYGVNVGGGVKNSLSILELFEILQDQLGKNITYVFGQERPSDQKIFISDNSLISSLSGWSPKTNFIEGIAQLTK
jgi:nucleoside-diphosphate-sugar epimerase